MTECVVAGGIGILTTSVYGVSLKEFIPELIKIGLFSWMTKKRRNVLKKFSLILVTYIYGYYPHKKLQKEMYKKLTKTFKKHSTMEIYRIYLFYKGLKLLFYEVGFEDKYFKKNVDELICHPLKMKNYLIKKLYIQKMFRKILVKLYNNLTSLEEQNRLKEDLVDTFIESSISYEELEKVLVCLGNELQSQYKEHINRYEKDFCEEKNYLKEIFDNIAKKDLPRKVKSSVKEICEILDDTKNVRLRDINMNEVINSVKDKYRKNSISECDDDLRSLDECCKKQLTISERINSLR
jgi:hypothetical protein